MVVLDHAPPDTPGPGAAVRQVLSCAGFRRRPHLDEQGVRTPGVGALAAYSGGLAPSSLCWPRTTTTRHHGETRGSPGTMLRTRPSRPPSPPPRALAFWTLSAPGVAAMTSGDDDRDPRRRVFGPAAAWLSQPGPQLIRRCHAKSALPPIASTRVILTERTAARAAEHPMQEPRSDPGAIVGLF